MNKIAPPPEILEIALPRKFGFLMEMHPYKVMFGGRYGLKSWSAADAILALGANQPLRIICGREIMKTLDDSVHALLSDRIKALSLEKFYRVLEGEIRGRNGTNVGYVGLGSQTAVSIKSLEGTDIFWAEEAQNIKERSWSLLLPTIRAEGSEVWVTFNPDMDADPCWKRWIEHPPPGTVSVETNYEYAKHCGFFTSKMEELRLHDLKYDPDNYENIWLGKPRTVVAGAIFSREVTAMVMEKRTRPIPYDPRLPVDCVWDLGWNDLMSIIMVQKPTPTTIAIINYLEINGARYDECVAELDKLGYRFGFDWMPHDATHHHPTSGTNAVKQMRAMHRKVKLIPKTDSEARIRAARMMFPRVYIDDTERKTDRGDLGGAMLIARLKKYKRNVPKTTDEPASPTHDINSHGADAFCYLAEIVEQITSEFAQPALLIPGFENVGNEGMGLLG